MEQIYKSLKYIALVFFFLILLLAVYKKAMMVSENEFIKGIFNNGQVIIKDKNDKAKIAKLMYTKDYENDEVINVFYNKEKNEAYIFEFGEFTRDILILILVNGLCITMIVLDRGKKPN